jgi:hypothetical protein
VPGCLLSGSAAYRNRAEELTIQADRIANAGVDGLADLFHRERIAT